MFISFSNFFNVSLNVDTDKVLANRHNLVAIMHIIDKMMKDSKWFQ